MRYDEYGMKRFLYILLLGGFTGLGGGALVAWAVGGTFMEGLWLAAGGGTLGVAVAAVIGMTRTGAFRD
ncbi:hypothetical protein [Streptomyces sp. NPDC056061]|uniref:hypothetical protein n=1 Tax=Streptomyces sp. NPDC056061 TaxID=3345700 RepID=UPI0035D94458